MRQVIADIKFFLGDNEDRSPLQNSLVYKSIINNPVNHHSGIVVLDGAAFNKFEMKQINYLFVVAPAEFAVVIDNKMAMYTHQFTFTNPSAAIDIVLFPHKYGKVPVRYLYGTMKYGDTETALNMTDEEMSAIEYDETLEDLVYDSTPGDDAFSTRIIQDFGDCEYGFSWDSVLEDLIIKPVS